jgi:hypothetical protein
LDWACEAVVASSAVIAMASFFIEGLLIDGMLVGKTHGCRAVTGAGAPWAAAHGVRTPVMCEEWQSRLR